MHHYSLLFRFAWFLSCFSAFFWRPCGHLLIHLHSNWLPVGFRLASYWFPLGILLASYWPLMVPLWPPMDYYGFLLCLAWFLSCDGAFLFRPCGFLYAHLHSPWLPIGFRLASSCFPLDILLASHDAAMGPLCITTASSSALLGSCCLSMPSSFGPVGSCKFACLPLGSRLASY